MFRAMGEQSGSPHGEARRRRGPSVSEAALQNISPFTISLPAQGKQRERLPLPQCFRGQVALLREAEYLACW